MPRWECTSYTLVWWLGQSVSISLRLTHSFIKRDGVGGCRLSKTESFTQRAICNNIPWDLFDASGEVTRPNFIFGRDIAEWNFYENRVTRRYSLHTPVMVRGENWLSHEITILSQPEPSSHIRSLRIRDATRSFLDFGVIQLLDSLLKIYFHFQYVMLVNFIWE